jgi:hypothetical protein
LPVPAWRIAEVCAGLDRRDYVTMSPSSEQRAEAEAQCISDLKKVARYLRTHGDVAG